VRLSALRQGLIAKKMSLMLSVSLSLTRKNYNFSRGVYCSVKWKNYSTHPLHYLILYHIIPYRERSYIFFRIW
jgi:hypothetical protein